MGDVIDGSGSNGTSIYGDTFADEAFTLKHKEKGVVAMCNDEPHTNSSQFYITLTAIPYFDYKNVVFGQVIR